MVNSRCLLFSVGDHTLKYSGTIIICSSSFILVWSFMEYSKLTSSSSIYIFTNGKNKTKTRTKTGSRPRALMYVFQKCTLNRGRVPHSLNRLPDNTIKVPLSSIKSVSFVQSSHMLGVNFSIITY